MFIKCIVTVAVNIPSSPFKSFYAGKYLNISKNLPCKQAFLDCILTLRMVHRIIECSKLERILRSLVPTPVPWVGTLLASTVGYFKWYLFVGTDNSFPLFSSVLSCDDLYLYFLFFLSFHLAA